MNSYITGETIKRLREARGLTQARLAEVLQVSGKTVSKWETGRGLPDISLVEPLAAALGISVPELFSGEQVINRNRSANLLRSALYVCPICGNVLHGSGPALVSCCGVTLPPLEAEEPDGDHAIQWETLDGELYVTAAHPMEKDHALSWIAYNTTDRFELVKLYPEGACAARFAPRGRGVLCWYCTRHGLFRRAVP